MRFRVQKPSLFLDQQASVSGLGRGEVKPAFLAEHNLAVVRPKHFNRRTETLPAMYFDYLGRLKLLVIVFNLVPYLALRIIQ